MLAHSQPEVAKRLMTEAEADVAGRWRIYEHWASMPVGRPVEPPGVGPAAGAPATVADEKKEDHHD